jgi:methylglutaconyl-CoA hydratase
MENTDWAQDKGLYAKVLENQVELDIDIAHFTAVISYNPGFRNEEDNLGRNRRWDTLAERAAISGELVCLILLKKH